MELQCSLHWRLVCTCREPVCCGVLAAPNSPNPNPKKKKIFSWLLRRHFFVLSHKLRTAQQKLLEWCLFPPPCSGQCMKLVSDSFSLPLQLFGMLSVCVITCKTGSRRNGYQPLYAWAPMSSLSSATFANHLLTVVQRHPGPSLYESFLQSVTWTTL